MSVVFGAEAQVYKSLEDARLEPEKVVELILKRKRFTNIPLDIYHFPNLKKLDLSRNYIADIDARFYSLMTQLEEVDFSSNKLTEISPLISQLSNLKSLRLNRNEIEIVPPEIADLEFLEELELWDNQISKLPVEMKEMKSLKKLELRVNPFTNETKNKILDWYPNSIVFFSSNCNCH